MSNRVSRSELRRINILRRATAPYPGSEKPIGCLMNYKWCFALTTEPAVKQLIKKGFLVLRRERTGRTNGRTLGFATESGKEYLRVFEMKHRNKK